MSEHFGPEDCRRFRVARSHFERSRDLEKLEAALYQTSRYSQIAKIGEGAQSVVFRAHCRELDRSVALKCLRPLSLVNPKLVEKFVRGGQLSAKIHHENFAQVYNRFRLGGCTPYECFELQLIDPDSSVQPLGSLHTLYMNSCPTGFRKNDYDFCRFVAALYARVIDAVTMMHEEFGFAHNDLMPRNMLLERLPEYRNVSIESVAPVSPLLNATRVARISVIDSGLMDSACESETKFYRNDIRNLCATLYSLLISARPFAPPPYDEHSQLTVLHPDELTEGRLASARIPAPIKRIIYRGLSDSEDCYTSARHLQEDLELLATLRPLQHARPSTKTACLKSSIRLWYKRSPAQAFAWALAALGLVVFVVVTLMLIWEQDRRQVAEQHRDLRSALSDLREGRPDAAARTLESSELQETFPWKFLSARTNETFFTLSEFGAKIIDVQLTDSPDTVWVLTAAGVLRAVDIQSRIHRRVSLSGLPAQPCTTLLISDDASTAVVITRLGQIMAWSLPNGQLIFSDDGGVRAAAISPDGKRVAYDFVESPDQAVQVRSTINGEVEQVLRIDAGLNHRYDIDDSINRFASGLAFSHDGEFLAQSLIGFTPIWELRSGTHLQTLSHTNPNTLTCPAVWTSSGQLITSGENGHAIVEFSRPFSAETTLTQSNILTEQVAELSLAENIAVFAGVQRNMISAVDIDAGHTVWHYVPSHDQTRISGAIASSRSGSHTAIGYARRVVVRDWRTPVRCTHQMDVVPLNSGLAISSDGRRMAVLGSPGEVTVWSTSDFAKPLEQITLASAFATPECMQFTNNGELWYASRKEKHAATFWSDSRGPNGKQHDFECELHELTGSKLPDSVLASTHLLVVGPDDSTAWIVPVNGSDILPCPMPLANWWMTMSGETENIAPLAAARVYHQQSRAWQFRPISAKRSAFQSLDYATRGDIAVFTGALGAISIVDLRTHTITAELKGHGVPVSAVEISQDGKYLVSGEASGLIIVWSLVEGCEVYRFHSKPGLKRITICPSASNVYTCHDDGTILFWPLF